MSVDCMYCLMSTKNYFHFIGSKQKDAAKSADIERSKFIEQQRQFEGKKRELLEKESQLQSQQSELDMRIGQAKDQKVGNHSLQETL